MLDSELDFTIARLASAVSLPLSGVRFTGDEERVLYHARLADMQAWTAQRGNPLGMEAAGPREELFFDPSQLACGIVTCGGLCPGVNDVIRSIVLSLYHRYGVHKVYGFRFGYEGLVPRKGQEPLELTPAAVNPIHEAGGTVLGSSRGPQDPAEMVRTLADMKVGILFAIGGDGTLRGAQQIAAEAARQGIPLSVIGIPKTIDNDVFLRAEDLRFRDRGRRGEAGDPCGPCRGGGRAQRHRPGKADGPRLRVYRRLFGPGRQSCKLLPHPRGSVHPA